MTTLCEKRRLYVCTRGREESTKGPPEQGDGGSVTRNRVGMATGFVGGGTAARWMMMEASGPGELDCSGWSYPALRYGGGRASSDQPGHPVQATWTRAVDGGTCTVRRSSRGVPRYLLVEAAAAVERPWEPGGVGNPEFGAPIGLCPTGPAPRPSFPCVALLDHTSVRRYRLHYQFVHLPRHPNILKPRLPIHLGPPSPPQEVGFVFGRQQSFLSAHLTSSFGTKSCTVTRGLPGALAGHDRTRPASTTLTNSCTCLRDHDRYDRQFLTHLPRRPRVHSAANKALRLVTSSPGFLRLPIFALTTSTCELHQSSNMADNARSFVPLTCHGHSRPVPHISFSSLEKDGQYFMVSACKGAPRDGMLDYRDHADGKQMETLCFVMASMETGTFLGHKGAVWQARLSPDHAYAATASADFTAKIWDTHTGEQLASIQHDHIVRAVAYPADNSDLLATGGMEKKLRIFDLSELSSSFDGNAVTIPSSAGFEIGEGVHTSSIKFICWTQDPNVIVTASDKTLRWLDLPSRACIHQEVLDGEIKSCEMVSLAPGFASPEDVGGGKPVLSVAAGKTAYFWGGVRAMEELKRIVLPRSIASVAIDVKGRKVVVGEEPGTWARLIRYDDETELETLKGHHGPIWSIAFSPDGKLYATGSEDGTIKLWKNCDGQYGLWKGGANQEKASAE
ncbi:hypothetical protein Purlil1_3346 [Purpureocillium lilacinum]|uniref:Serine-threonine kinase receptor-associated protein n=1 Tax=Purpureocillium lilacinum TaxID=33203 RepID=A0ABR0C812_PURLI|nr:hypothetical protein Purlil1_3346 [Purpureocillium lilacinum]